MIQRKNTKTALITGATGYVGSHLTRRLVKDSWQIHVIKRSKSELVLLDSVIDDITIHEHDGTTEEMLRILKNSSPDVVFHLASLFLAKHEPKDIDPLIQSNLHFGIQLVEAMVANGVSSLINTGTSWQHYNNENYNPVNLYAATKQAFEAILEYYIKAQDMKIINLKLFETYGPNDPRSKLMNILKAAIITGECLDMSEGEQLIDIVHVNDVVDAFLVAGNRLFNGIVKQKESYAVSSGERLCLKDLVNLCEQIVKMKIPINWGRRPYRDREVMIPWSLGLSLPGWKPKISIKD